MVDTPADIVTVTTPFIGAEPRQPAVFGAPRIGVDDLAVTRGFGAFEFVHGKGTRTLALSEHLTRLNESCEHLLMPAIDIAAWEEATRLLVSHTAQQDREFALRYIVTAGGPEGHLAWIKHTLDDPDRPAKRLLPRTAITLDRGTPIDYWNDRPWILYGVKGLSYAGHMIAEQYAVQQGFDDAIYVSSDGYFLEGSTSSLLALRNGELVTTEYSAGVLNGTTQRVLFDHAEQIGLPVSYGRIHTDEIPDLEGLWLVASGRLASTISRVDDAPVATRPDLTQRFIEVLEGAMVEI